MGKPHDDPSQLQAQLQGEGQGQLEGQGQGQLEGQGQLQGEGQGQGQHQGEGQNQSQSSWDANSNGNGNGNLNGNGNFNGNGNLNVDGNLNGNANYNSDGNFNSNGNFNCNTNDVTVHVDVSACVSPGTIYLNFPDACLNASDGGSLVFMPQYLTPTIYGDSGNDSIISLDQVNSLVASNSANCDSVAMGCLSSAGDGGNAAIGDSLAASSGSGDGSMSVLSGNIISAGGGTTVGGATAGDAGTATAASTATAQLDAFTQSIVLGANIQYNNFSLNLAGNDVTTSGAHHGA